MKGLFLSFSILLLVGCTSLGASYQSSNHRPSKDQSLLLVYRPWGMVGLALKPEIYVNGVKIGRIANGAFFSRELTLGKSTITVVEPLNDSFGLNWRQKAQIDVLPGKVYSLRVLVGGVMQISIDENEGAPDAIANCREADSSDIF